MENSSSYNRNFQNTKPNTDERKLVTPTLGNTDEKTLNTDSDTFHRKKEWKFKFATDPALLKFDNIPLEFKDLGKPKDLSFETNSAGSSSDFIITDPDKYLKFENPFFQSIQRNRTEQGYINMFSSSPKQNDFESLKAFDHQIQDNSQFPMENFSKNLHHDNQVLIGINHKNLVMEKMDAESTTETVAIGKQPQNVQNRMNSSFDSMLNLLGSSNDTKQTIRIALHGNDWNDRTSHNLTHISEHFKKLNINEVLNTGTPQHDYKNSTIENAKIIATPIESNFLNGLENNYNSLNYVRNTLPTIPVTSTNLYIEKFNYQNETTPHKIPLAVQSMALSDIRTRQFSFSPMIIGDSIQVQKGNIDLSQNYSPNTINNYSLLSKKENFNLDTNTNHQKFSVISPNKNFDLNPFQFQEERPSYIIEPFSKNMMPSPQQKIPVYNVEPGYPYHSDVAIQQLEVNKIYCKPKNLHIETEPLSLGDGQENIQTGKYSDTIPEIRQITPLSGFSNKIRDSKNGAEFSKSRSTKHIYDGVRPIINYFNSNTSQKSLITGDILKTNKQRSVTPNPRSNLTILQDQEDVQDFKNYLNGQQNEQIVATFCFNCEKHLFIKNSISHTQLCLEINQTLIA